MKVLRKHLRGSFIDSLRVFVKGGAGGMGLPKYGGIGGKGGDVFVVAKEDVSLKRILQQFPTKRFLAGNGGNSTQRRVLGEPGKDISLEAPVGITVVGENGRIIGELDGTGSSVQVAVGGPGGCPDNGFSGRRGQAQSVTLDLKLIADVGFVGFPNAGKSTLLRALSRAKPKVASYPFTTVRPNVGVMEFPDLRQISLADLPGLIEGAHANVGMGHRFLKHVERTKLLLLVVDVGGFRLSPAHRPRTCLETVVLLNKELELYKPELLNKPALLVVNKMDTEGALDKFSAIKHQLSNLADFVSHFPEEIRPSRVLRWEAVVPISAHLGTDVDRLAAEVRRAIDDLAPPVPLAAPLEAELSERGPTLT